MAYLICSIHSSTDLYSNKWHVYLQKHNVLSNSLFDPIAVDVIGPDYLWNCFTTLWPHKCKRGLVPKLKMANIQSGPTREAKCLDSTTHHRYHLVRDRRKSEKLMHRAMGGMAVVIHKLGPLKIRGCSNSLLHGWHNSKWNIDLLRLCKPSLARYLVSLPLTVFLRG
jgi:hypothetical protein